MPLNPASVMTAQPLNIQSPLDAYARVLAAQHAQTQNVLAQQQLAEYQRARGEDEAVRNYFVKAQTAGTPTTSPEFVQGLLGISPARGMSYQQNVAAAQKAATEESARRAKLALDKIAMYRDALVNVRTPEQGYKWVMAQVNDPDMAGTPISKMSVMNVVIPTDPKGFEDWKNMEALGATEFIKLNKPHWVEGGGSQVPVSGLTGRPSETASPIAKTATPGELLTDKREQERIRIENLRLGLEGRRVKVLERDSALARDPAFQGRMAAAKATGEAIAKGEAAARQALPGAIANAEDAIRIIDQMVGKQEVRDKNGKVIQAATAPHPGFAPAVGMGGWGTLSIPGLAQITPGTDAANFKTLFDQTQGAEIGRAHV